MQTPRYRIGRSIAVAGILGVMIAAGLLNSGFSGMRGLRYVYRVHPYQDNNP